MRIAAGTLTFLSMILFVLAGSKQSAGTPGAAPEYTSDAQLKFPEHYREWVYLSSGFDMSYSAGMRMGDQHQFDNVFVNPEAYRGFLATGSWPDKTLLVLEVRNAQGKGSINQRGNFQTGVADVEVHVKDEARFPGKWAFFGFSGSQPARMIPTSAECYSCHAAHAAVDTTFVQFYPTLMPIAGSKGTLATAFRKEAGSAANK